ncbi:hypothetical protein IGI04_011102 [Brassica rapa subsp. trilocularis]|uniref:Cytochrome P450 n=1 Tax=Brassica rapa subsp. trilocularis TaxID=1813537 RepID=A0ABQ7N2Z6_BRACM|nr:hypothetical protein IGI04_011102 [Brassica rapa subsp. trilocularis]
MSTMMMILLVCSIILITTLFLQNRSTGKKSNTPKSPPRFPLIGNLHQLGRHPHRSLCSLSQRYGPLMLLHFGRVPVLVVSSADAARDVLKTHDRVFASRPWTKITEKLLYNGRDVASAPYGEYWRQMKSVCVVHLLSNKMVRSFRDVREEEISLMIEKIRESSSLPQLQKTGNDFDEFLEKVLDDHVDGDRDGTDFVDVLLTIQRDKSVGFQLDRLSIKAIILDVFVGATDTSYTLMEWVMTELLRHRECLNKLQEEVRTICKGRSSVLEEDIQDMKYLKAVIKETLRLHPPLPLMAPHESTHDVRLREYDIPAGTQILISAWAIGREALTWGLDVEEFRPERHLDSSVDFRGQDFELIPFGAGRRICPAISFAVVLNEVVLATLVHQFDWRLPVELTEDQTNVAESTGLAIHRMFPLYAIASSTT